MIFAVETEDSEKKADKPEKPEKEPAGSQSGEGAPEKKAAEAPTRSRLILRGAVIVVAVCAALIAWLVTRDNGGSPGTSALGAAPSRIVTVAELREAEAGLEQLIYWAGPIPGKELQLTELSEGGVQVAYLPEGTEAGKGSPASLTIGTYPMPDPDAALDAFAKRPGSVVSHASDGRRVALNKRKPTSVYFSSPDNSVQVEVYDPSPRRAIDLALSGRVQPAG